MQQLHREEGRREYLRVCDLLIGMEAGEGAEEWWGGWGWRMEGQEKR
jgi:hypothetical protein